MRLTIRNSDGSVSQPTDLKWSEALEKLAHYEDLEEKGLLLELPYRIGQELYTIRATRIYDEYGDWNIGGVIIPQRFNLDIFHRATDEGRYFETYEEALEELASRLGETKETALEKYPYLREEKRLKNFTLESKTSPWIEAGIGNEKKRNAEG